MSIQGGILAATKRQDPYLDLPQTSLIHDYAQVRPTVPTPYLKRNGILYPEFQADPLATLTRGELIVPDASGIWRATPVNDDGLFPGSGGLNVYEATTNKCTNYNAAPQALVALTTLAGFNAAAVTGVSAGGGDAGSQFGVVDDSAAMAGGELARLLSDGKLNGRAYRNSNTAGAATSHLFFGGQPGNTNTHAYSVFIRVLANPGGISIRDGSGNVVVSIAGGVVPSGWIRYTGTRAPGASTNQLVVSVGAGGDALVILNQLEEKAYATPPVIVSGASASRGAADVTVNSLGGLLAYPFTAFVSADFSLIDNTNRVLMSADAGNNNNRLQLYRASNNTAVGVGISGGVSNFSTTFAGKGGARRISMAVYAEADGFTTACDGVAVGKVLMAMPTINRLCIGQASISSFANSPILRCGIIPGGDASLARRLSAYNTGLFMDLLG